MTQMTPLHPGDRFPALAVALAEGRGLRLPDALAGHYGMVLFYRGSRCPYCNAQLCAFQRSLGRLTDVDTLVVVSGAPPGAWRLTPRRSPHPCAGRGKTAIAVDANKGERNSAAAVRRLARRGPPQDNDNGSVQRRRPRCRRRCPTRLRKGEATAMAIPPDVRELLSAPSYAHLSSARADGSPRNVVLRAGLEGDHILVCTSDVTWKAKDLRRGPRVAMSVLAGVRPDERCRFTDPISFHHTSAAFPSHGPDRVCFVIAREKAAGPTLGFAHHPPQDGHRIGAG
jgi:hypothetical protein